MWMRPFTAAAGLYCTRLEPPERKLPEVRASVRPVKESGALFTRPLGRRGAPAPGDMDQRHAFYRVQCGSVANFLIDGVRLGFGRNYAVSASNCCLSEPTNARCCLRII
jgi:hypothetical protein